MEKIDLVYMWVDDSDKKWRDEKNYWLGEIQGKAPMFDEAAVDARWRDNDELKFALRSVDKFAPWINHIFIVTGFGQVPKWLNTKHPKITIVPHEQIMPKDSIPTFNSVAIEMCLMNIPNLSEHFLLANDDMFFYRDVGPDFFFDQNGRAIVWYKQNKISDDIGYEMEMAESDYRRTVLVAGYKINQIFGKKFWNLAPAHNIDPYIKSSMAQCRNHPLLTRDFAIQIRNKFRTNWEIQRWIFNLYDLAHGRAVFKRVRYRKKAKHWIYNRIYKDNYMNAPMYCDNTNNIPANANPSLFCINDTPNTTDEIRKQNWEFLNRKFPDKSQFEK